MLLLLDTVESTEGLRVEIAGEWTAGEMAAFLGAMHDLYDFQQFHQKIALDGREVLVSAEQIPWPGELVIPSLLRDADDYIVYVSIVLEHVRAHTDFTDYVAALRLKRVAYGSPGFTDLIGAGESLNQLRRLIEVALKEYRKFGEQNLRAERLRLDNERRRLENERRRLENERVKLENEEKARLNMEAQFENERRRLENQRAELENERLRLENEKAKAELEQIDLANQLARAKLIEALTKELRYKGVPKPAYQAAVSAVANRVDVIEMLVSRDMVVAVHSVPESALAETSDQDSPRSSDQDSPRSSDQGSPRSSDQGSPRRAQFDEQGRIRGV